MKIKFTGALTGLNDREGHIEVKDGKIFLVIDTEKGGDNEKQS